ncbi:MAG: hypothetical protein V7K88_21275 [Nostoc sp.]|uniref:hypothetical protein n=1 Tax=Nostoc sp. TaxID=1180 RepID=UPI002FFB18E2
MIAEIANVVAEVANAIAEVANAIAEIANVVAEVANAIAEVANADTEVANVVAEVANAIACCGRVSALAFAQRSAGKVSPCRKPQKQGDRTLHIPKSVGVASRREASRSRSGRTKRHRLAENFKNKVFACCGRVIAVCIFDLKQQSMIMSIKRYLIEYHLLLIQREVILWILHLTGNQNRLYLKKS